jgi:hypothetical protein
VHLQHHCVATPTASANIRILNNTVVTYGAEAAVKISNYPKGPGPEPRNHKNITVMNNIVVNLSSRPGPAISVTRELVEELHSDHNLFFAPKAKNAAFGSVAGEAFDLRHWQETFRKDANSLTGDPGFVNILGPDGILATFDEDLRIKADSIVRGKGAPLWDVFCDRLGIERPKDKDCDLGAYQFTAPAQPEDYYKKLGLPALVRRNSGAAL